MAATCPTGPNGSKVLAGACRAPLHRGRSRDESVTMGTLLHPTRMGVSRPERAGRPAVRRLRTLFAWLLAVLAFTVLLVPVLLLPLSTAVPTWAWILLLLLDAALAVWLVRSRPARLRAALFAGVAVVAVLAVVASQVFAATPPIIGADGRPVPGSIASLEKVTLNGTEQWITIRGEDVANPVLLNLGMGGPGGGGFATRTQFEPLERYFTVVSWDEPGTGKSIGAVPFDQLTKQRFVEDGRALTEWLLQRFGQQRIYLYGVSWSSILGIWLIQEHPELMPRSSAAARWSTPPRTTGWATGWPWTTRVSAETSARSRSWSATVRRRTGDRTRCFATSTTSTSSTTTWEAPATP